MRSGSPRRAAATSPALRGVALLGHQRCCRPAPPSRPSPETAESGSRRRPAGRSCGLGRRLWLGGGGAGGGGARRRGAAHAPRDDARLRRRLGRRVAAGRGLAPRAAGACAPDVDLDERSRRGTGATGRRSRAPAAIAGVQAERDRGRDRRRYGPPRRRRPEGAAQAARECLRRDRARLLARSWCLGSTLIANRWTPARLTRSMTCTTSPCGDDRVGGDDRLQVRVLGQLAADVLGRPPRRSLRSPFR